MTSRERVRAAMEHREPDRVPIDVGGCDSSTLTGIAYNRLRAFFDKPDPGAGKQKARGDGATDAAAGGGISTWRLSMDGSYHYGPEDSDAAHPAATAPIHRERMVSSGLSALGADADEPPRIWDVVQQVALVDEQMRKRLGGDVIGIHPLPAQWRESTLPDGSPCLLPERFRPVTLDDGSEAVLTGGGEVSLLRRPDTLYFEPVHAPYADTNSEADFDCNPEPIETSDWPPWWDLPLEQLAQIAQFCRTKTDCYIAGNVYDHVLAAGQSLRGFEQFMIDLVAEKSLAHALMERLVDTYLQRFESYLPVAEHCDIIVVNDDLGTQQGLQMSPQLYREMVKPHHARLWQGLKAMAGKPLLLHSCGSVYDLIPDIIEAGIDALNPVQVSAAKMDTARLKQEFGRDIVFWGGGCDTQHVLPRGSVEQVRADVQRRVEDLSGEGGFVFCPVHNIQPDVPPENILACYAAARDAR